MPRGGLRTPPKRTPPGGPGQYSRRTDGQQIATPGIGGESELQYGDVQTLRSTQKIAPLPHGVLPPRTGGGPPSVGRPPEAGGRIPPYLLEMESQRPAEPTTAGLSVGPGPGPEALSQPAPMDPREAVLVMLTREFGNENVQAMLDNVRRERLAAQTAPLPSNLPGPPAAPGTPSLTDAALDVTEAPEGPLAPTAPEGVPPKES